MKHRLHVAVSSVFTVSLLTTAALAHLPETAKLLASDAGPSDRFGTGVAIDGSTAAVGAPFHQVSGTAGAVYVFQRSTHSNWLEVAKLTPTGAGALDMFGAGLALDDGYLAVSAPAANSDEGAIYIFSGSGSSWSQTQVLTASDAGPGHSFGHTLEMYADTLAVGAPGNEAAYVFRLVAGSWVEEQKLTLAGGAAGDLFGNSVSAYEDELVVGAPFDDTDEIDGGSVYLFERSGTTWTQMLRFGSATPGVGDGFGYSACIRELFVGAGAPFDDDQGLDAGAAHYFRRNGPGAWISEGTLTAAAALMNPDDHLGETIEVGSQLFLIGQPGSDLQGNMSGGAQTFAEREGVWAGDVMFPGETMPGDALGASISRSGCWMVVGAPMDDDVGENSGSAFIFQDILYTEYYCIPGISAKGCAATLSTAGTASESETSGFTVTADGVEGGIAGLFFYGTNGRQGLPWGNGTSLHCVVPPVLRMGTITSIGSGTCGGQFVQDLNATWCSTCPKPQKNPGAGTEIYLQLWYRDPQNTSNQTTALSNAASIGICP